MSIGRVEAAITVADVIRRWRPGYAILTGLAGGRCAAGVKIGDVVISTRSPTSSFHLRDDRYRGTAIHKVNTGMYESTDGEKPKGFLTKSGSR